MKNIKIKISSIFIILICIMSIEIISYAHSGRTDGSGGHHDNQNKSGLGNYHYHCGGHPAHLHTNGVCPYAEKSTVTTSSTPTKIEVDQVSILDSKEEIKAGDTVQLSVNVEPTDATNKNVIWKSSDESVLKVDSNGKVTSFKNGVATITATSINGKTDSTEIYVHNLAESVKIINDLNELEIDKEITLNPLIEPENSEYSLKWSSSNEDIVIVDENGRIKAIKEGQSTITVETNNGKTDKLLINVKNNDKANNENKIEDEISSNDENTGVGFAIVTIIIVYVVYKKFKVSKNDKK